MSIRSVGHSVDEDLLLCQMYLDISQDLITGVYQFRDQFWSRVVDAYNNAKVFNWEIRNKKSLQHRFANIEKAVKKLNRCVRQVEMLRPSGASEQDILTQAKVLFMQVPNFKKGFKFDHVWALRKDFEKFNDGNVERKKTRKQNDANISSDSEARAPDSPCVSSPSLSFSVNLNEDVADDSTPSQRPSGVKKAKMKRKIDDGYMKIVESQNNRIVEVMNSATERQKETNDIEREKMRLKELKYDRKIMSMDVDSVLDPVRREYFRQEQQ
ncbi:glutathione S-transferase T3-like [Nicotiana tomentosiformis]|uniref:glutathione S-transferase T3-like n=1 Tax=Nicotiana tomentosiformis TaxID=4098 RepID=UPI00051B7252|nr:uncharacterized protein LOC104111570 [Nicotiana tomentosiformis]